MEIDVLHDPLNFSISIALSILSFMGSSYSPPLPPLGYAVAGHHLAGTLIYSNWYIFAGYSMLLFFFFWGHASRWGGWRLGWVVLILIMLRTVITFNKTLSQNFYEPIKYICGYRARPYNMYWFDWRHDKLIELCYVKCGRHSISMHYSVVSIEE